jgi:hypothetical protein
MGREIKRVALDFDWPLDEIWHGYLNPHYAESRECPFCKGSKQNPATKQISDDWYDFENTGRKWRHNITQDEVDALIASRRLWDFTREDPTYRPTAAEVNAWSVRAGFGHDSINQWICVETRAKRLGVYGPCTAGCDEDGRMWSSPEAKVAYEAWENFEPPAGEGYQFWENTTEGSPQSPVFDTAEKLARWLTDTGASTFGRETTTYEKWLAFVRGPGWAPSAMTDARGVLMSGVDAVSEVDGY